MGILSKTVWSEASTMHIPLRYQAIYKLVLPFMYAATALYGLFSLPYNIDSFEIIFGELYGDVWSLAVFASGLAAFVGVSFYKRLIWLEVIGALMIVTLLLVYALSVPLAFLFGTNEFHALVILRAAMFAPVPCWRILDIVREMRPARHV